MRKMETSATSKIPAPGSSLESQGRAVSMPRLNAELQVTPHFTILVFLWDTEFSYFKL